MQNHDFFFLLYDIWENFFFFLKKIWDNWLLLELSGAYISFFFSFCLWCVFTLLLTVISGSSFLLSFCGGNVAFWICKNWDPFFFLLIPLTLPLWFFFFTLCYHYLSITSLYIVYILLTT